MTPSDVPAVVLAAGEGRRLRPLTNTRPKPMLPVANRPILEYVLEAVNEAGLERVVLVVGYKHERIRNYFGDGDAWGMEIEYVEQPTQLGTGHAVAQARDLIDGEFVVLNGDSIVEPDLVEDILAAKAAADGPVVAITSAEHPSTFGVVDLEGDRIVAIEEKPLDPAPSALINAGVYGFDPTIFDAIDATNTVDGELSLPATLDRLANETPIPTVHYDGTWLDVTNLWDLTAVNAIQLHRGERRSGGRVDAGGATVSADALVGEGVHLGPSVTVGGGVSVGDNAVLEANVVLENAVVLPDARVGAGSVVRDAVIGANATVGPNVTIEGGDATVVVGETVYRGVNLGAVIGDNTDVGGAAVFEPGSIVGNDATVQGGTFLSGRFETGATVRRG